MGLGISLTSYLKFIMAVHEKLRFLVQTFPVMTAFFNQFISHKCQAYMIYKNFPRSLQIRFKQSFVELNVNIINLSSIYVSDQNIA